MAITGGILKPAALESYKDHRIAMSLAVAGLAADKNSPNPTIVNDAECAAVTYPSFLEDFNALGANFYLL